VLELLAAIQSVDPPSLVLWGLALFAAGMYPVGFMLGSTCSPCCTGSGLPPCTSCTDGELPDTVTVTFNGFTDQTQGPDLISLSFSACFGSGASARVTDPGGDPDTDKGPITGVTLTNGGSGYAQLGRVAPTLTISGGTGTGATFTPTLTSTNDACGIPSWSLTSVAFKGGTGYIDGESLTITVAEGDAEVQTATAVVNTTRTQPTLSASIGGGTGATFTVTTSANFGTPTTWGVASVAVTNGGSGYTDGGALSFSGSGDLVTLESASAYIVTGRVVPSLTGSVSGTGTSASITPVLTESTDWNGRAIWSVTSFTIANGGSGYSENDTVSVAVSDGQSSEYSYFYAYVSAVDEDGVITAIQIDYGGEFYKSNGVIQSVDLWWGGSYYDDDGIPNGVTVTGGGQYYREDAEATPYVAEVTVTVASQGWPSEGSGAEFEATVDNDTGSETFGQVTGLSVADGGDDYLAFVWITNCMARFDGRSVVLLRNATATLYPSGLGACVYLSECNVVPGCTVERQIVTLGYAGPNAKPTIGLLVTKQTYNQQGTQEIQQVQASANMEADSLVADCSSFGGTDGPLSFYPTSGLPVGASATVSAGGQYEKPPTCPSYSQIGISSVKTTIQWDGQTWVAVDGDTPNYNDPTCDESYAFGGGSIGDTTCGSRVGMLVYVYGKCGDYLYFTGANTGFSLVWQNCRFEWQFLISISRSPVPPNPADPDVGYFWVNAEPIPIGDDGYPEGEVAMRVDTPVTPTAGPTELTASFSRVLP
jgi:hypothetical protein